MISTLVTVVFISLLIQVCYGETTTATITSLPSLLTGDCLNATTTSIIYNTYYSPTYVTTTSLMNGHWEASIYSTSHASYNYYYYLTLGCQSGRTACCPSEAISTQVTSNPYGGYGGVPTTTTIVSIKPVTACPADYVTLVDQGIHIDATHTVSINPVTLCCPSGWKIWPTAFSQGDAPCYQPWPSLTPGENALVSQLSDTTDTKSSITLDYSTSPFVTTIGGGRYTLGVGLGVRLTRSYKLKQPSTSSGGLAAGTIVAIVVPVTGFFIGVTVLCWFCRRRRKGRVEKKKMEEKRRRSGLPEVGEGLRHELEPATKMAAPNTRDQGMQLRERDDEMPGTAELGNGLSHELELGAKPDDWPKTTHGAAEADGRSVHELEGKATLKSPWDNRPLHELPERPLIEPLPR